MPNMFHTPKRPLLSRSTATGGVLNAIPSSSASKDRGPQQENPWKNSTKTQKDNVKHIALNMSITRMSDSTRDSIRRLGKDHPTTISKVDILLDAFLCILKEEKTMNHVNVATLMHRTALIVSEANFEECTLGNHEKLIQTLTIAVCDSLHQFEPRHISSILWAYGKLGRSVLTVLTPDSSVPEVLSLLLEKAECLCNEFSSKEISSIMVGLANMGFQRKTCKRLLHKLIRSAAKKIRQFKGQELSNLVWGLGHLDAGKDTKRLLPLIARNLHPEDFSPQQVSNLMWGFAKLGYLQGNKLFDDVVQHSRGRLMHFTPQGVSNLIWALAKLMYLPEISFLQQVTQCVMQSMSEFEPQHVSNLLYAFAIFGDMTVVAQLCHVTKKYFRDRITCFTIQELVNFLWALAMLDELDVNTFEEGITSLLGRVSLKSIKDAERRQVYQCIMHLRVSESKEAVNDLISLEFQEECLNAWVGGQNSKPTYAVGLAVLLTLEKMGFAPSMQFVSGFLPLLVDSACRADGMRVSVEVSIKQHYFTNRKDRLEGPRLWAMRMQEFEGLVVLRVDADEWKNLPVNGRQEFLTRQLDTLRSYPSSQQPL